jgi:hypothetical protein
MDSKFLSVTGLFALCAVAMPVIADAVPRDGAAQTQAQGAPTYGLENPNVRRGYEAIMAAIGLVPRATGLRTQYQAQIAYALDQAQIDCPTTLAALDMVSRQTGFARATYGALRDVTTATARCNGNGIAATDDAGGARRLLAAGPGVGFGGGSSNYGQ